MGVFGFLKNLFTRQEITVKETVTQTGSAAPLAGHTQATFGRQTLDFYAIEKARKNTRRAKYVKSHRDHAHA